MLLINPEAIYTLDNDFTRFELHYLCVSAGFLKPLRRLQFIFPPAICLQISSEWCVIGCVRTTGAGARGLTSVFPAAISDGAAPVLSPATSSTGERSVRKGVFFFRFCFESFSANVRNFSECHHLLPCKQETHDMMQ